MSAKNQLFEISKNIKSDSRVSKVRVGRDYLISKHTAEELNTYVSFDPFRVFNDAYPIAVLDEKTGKESSEPPKAGTPGVRSIFNAAGAVVVGTATGKVSTKDIISGEASDWRISNNVPLMDNRDSRLAIRKSSDCSVKALVQASADGELGRATYAFSDFMYCKHLGKVSNNYLITLRRFPIPVDDYISTMGKTGDMRRDPDIASKNSTSIGCLVTWMGTPGNDMSNLLKYSYNLPFKSQDAKWETVQNSGDQNQGIANGLAGAFDPKYREQYMQGKAGAAFNNSVGKMFNLQLGQPPYTDMLNFRDNNKVYGPVDAVKSTYMRSDEGLKFTQKFSITFDYELRSYNGINGRQAMLDLLSNILSVTYSTGTFWGGGYRGTGAHQNNIFANMEIFKCKGGFTDFADAFAKDLTTATDAFRQNMKAKHGNSWMSMLKSALNQLGGMLVAGALNGLGRPAKAMANSLLSPAPVGFWHLTIGNPHHPIMSVGNLVLQNTTVEHYGPLGLDDFPTGIKVTCELVNGKPRDIRDLEKIYMHGNDRIYTSMGPKVFDMYKSSKMYKDSNLKPTSIKIGDMNSKINVSKSNNLTLDLGDISKMRTVLQKYFGHSDTYSIYVAACEQEMGAHKKKVEKKEPNQHKGQVHNA